MLKIGSRDSSTKIRKANQQTDLNDIEKLKKQTLIHKKPFANEKLKAFAEKHIRVIITNGYN